jgi:hypothetical protein
MCARENTCEVGTTVAKAGFAVLVEKDEDPAKMRVVDLRAALEKRGLDTGELKKVLQGRLQEAFDKE